MVLIRDIQQEVSSLCGWTLPTTKSSWLLVLYCLPPATNFVLLFLLPEIPQPRRLWLLILQDPIQKASSLESSFLAPDTYHPGLVLLLFTLLSTPTPTPNSPPRLATKLLAK